MCAVVAPEYAASGQPRDFWPPTIHSAHHPLYHDHFLPHSTRQCILHTTERGSCLLCFFFFFSPFAFARLLTAKKTATE